MRKGYSLSLWLDLQRDFKTTVYLIFVRAGESLKVVLIQGGMESLFVGLIHRGRSDEKTIIVVDVGHVFLGKEFGIGHVEEVLTAQQIDQMCHCST